MTTQKITGKMADEMMQGAIDFCLSQNVNPKDHATELVTALRAKVEDTMTEALADGREAMDAGMTGWASATMTATFRLAGINAAKDILSN